jgi:membrane protein
MQKLTGLPWLGPAAAWFLRSRLWAVYCHLDARKWTRLAAAITFTSFLTLFPVLGLSAALGAVLLTDRRLTDVEEWLSDQVPGISQELDVAALFANAGTVGLVSLAVVVPTGANWIDSLRGCLREVWDLPDPEGNIVLRRILDLGVLAGLGVVTLLSLGVSVLGTGAVQWADRRLGVGSPFQPAALLLAMVVTFFLLMYLLVWLPGVRPPRNAVLAACVMGAVGFELLKLLLGGYLTQVATRNLYGAFGMPIALLIWINLIAKLLLVCCAWTATAVTPAERPEADALDAEDDPEDGPDQEAAPSACGEASAPAADDGGGTHSRRPPGRPDSPP